MKFFFCFFFLEFIFAMSNVLKKNDIPNILITIQNGNSFLFLVLYERKQKRTRIPPMITFSMVYQSARNAFHNINFILFLCFDSVIKRTELINVRGHFLFNSLLIRNKYIFVLAPDNCIEIHLFKKNYKQMKITARILKKKTILFSF